MHIYHIPALVKARNESQKQNKERKIISMKKLNKTKIQLGAVTHTHTHTVDS